METAELLSLVEHLEDNIDELEESLEPLLEAALSATTKKLPVLDKAKLYVLVVYSIESLLFSYLRLNGVQAKDHPVFKELTRVKQYFEKVRVAEAGPTKPRQNLSLNKQAAGRFIKHALAGNDRHDLERAEREAREKLLAKRRLNKLSAEKKQTLQENQPQVVDEVHEEVKALKEEEDSESSISENDDQEDAVMADASETNPEATAGDPVAVVDPSDMTAGQSGGGLTRRQKHGDNTQNKGRRGKRGSGKAALQKRKPYNG